MNEKLLPCPFCGGDAIVRVIEPHEHFLSNMSPYSGGAFVECTKCSCALAEPTEEEAIAAWNTRDNRQRDDDYFAGVSVGWETAWNAPDLSELTEEQKEHIRPYVERTCKWTYDSNIESYDTECGECISWEPYGTPNYCPNCGHKFNGEYRKIEREVVER